MKSLFSLGVLAIIGAFSVPVSAEVFIPAGTEMESLNPGAPTFGVTGLQTFTDSSGGNGFRFTQKTSCSLGNKYLSANTLNMAYSAACHEAAGTFIGENSDGTVTIGKGNAEIVVTNNGISDSGGNNLIKTESGTVSIGENSLKLREQGGRQQMWATDANEDSIDIDITNGSRLLINGRDVEKSIDNVGALSAALGSVPAVSADSQFTCGFGGGTHSSAYALSAGCASRVSDRFSVNAALATVVNNHTGDQDDNLSARAGFTFKLGKVDDSPKVVARKAAALHDEVAALRDENQSIKASKIEQQILINSLMARLENLEKIASGQASLLGDRASVN